MHVKQQIRDAIVSLLDVDKIQYKHVYNTRLEPIRDVLPYVSVWVERETIQHLLIHPTDLQQRDLNFVISCRNRIPTRKEILEDEMDNMQEEIEEKLTETALNAALSGGIKGLVYQDSTVQVVTDENDRTYGELIINLSLTVHTQEGAPSMLV